MPHLMQSVLAVAGIRVGCNAGPPPSLAHYVLQVLEADELLHVVVQQHPGTAVLQAMGACVRASGAKDVEKLRLDESISALQDLMGGCERIFRTPIPLSYTR